MVVFNLEVTHAARFALKTTTSFKEEPKKEKLARKAEENGKIIAKNSRFSDKNGVIFVYFCSQSTKSDVCVWEMTRRDEPKLTERIGWRMPLQPHHSFETKRPLGVRKILFHLF